MPSASSARQAFVFLSAAFLGRESVTCSSITHALVPADAWMPHLRNAAAACRTTLGRASGNPAADQSERSRLKAHFFTFLPGCVTRIVEVKIMTPSAAIDPCAIRDRAYARW